MTRSVDIARCSNGDWTEVELGCQSSFHASQSPKCTQLSFQAISFGVAQHDSRPLMQHIPGRNWEAVGWTFGHTHTDPDFSGRGLACAFELSCVGRNSGWWPWAPAQASTIPAAATAAALLQQLYGAPFPPSPPSHPFFAGPEAFPWLKSYTRQRNHRPLWHQRRK